MRRRRLPLAVTGHAYRALILLASAGLVAGGCGDSNAPSQQEFAQQADQVCGDVERRVEQIDQLRPSNPQELAGQVEQIRQAATNGVQRLRDLEVPEGQPGDQAEQFVDAATSRIEDRLLPALEQLQAAAQRGDRRAIVQAARGFSRVENERVEQLARQIGAQQCAT